VEEVSSEHSLALRTRFHISLENTVFFFSISISFSFSFSFLFLFFSFLFLFSLFLLNTLANW
jgi:hypothetical protein